MSLSDCDSAHGSLGSSAVWRATGEYKEEHELGSWAKLGFRLAVQSWASSWTRPHAGLCHLGEMRPTLQNICGN